MDEGAGVDEGTRAEQGTGTELGIQRVAVVGAGAVGGFFAAHLSGTKHDVVACVRRPFTDWLIESDTAPFSGPANAITSPDDVPWDGPANWVLVGVKAHQTAGAAPWFDRLCGPDTTVVVMQNGVEDQDRLQPYVHGATTIPTAVYCGTELLAPGHIAHAQRSRLVVPESPASQALSELFADTPVIDIQPDPAFLNKTWVKLSINSVINGLCALTGQTMQVLAQPALAPVAHDIMAEALTVANAEGATLSLDGIDERIAAMGTMDTRPSTLQDVEAGRTTEHDAIQGAVKRLGEKHGIPTPATNMVWSLLEARSAQLR